MAPFSYGTTHLLMSHLEFMQRLAALDLPPPQQLIVVAFCAMPASSAYVLAVRMGASSPASCL